MRTREGNAVVAPDDLRQTITLKDPLGDHLHRDAGSREKRSAAKEISTLCVAHCERIAVGSSSQAEFTFEVRGPHVIGRCSYRQSCIEWPIDWADLATTSSGTDQALASQQLADRARRWPGNVREFLLEPRYQLPGPPMRTTAY